VSEVIVESCRTLPLVFACVCFRAGAVHDPADKAGLARITARMLRRGTQTRSAEQIEERVDALGAELSASVGLGTSSLSCELLRRNIEPFGELLSELLAAPRFDDDELARLLRQAEAELVSSRDEDALLAMRALRRNLLSGHPHGQRIAGSVVGLHNITRADVVDFHRLHYCRANAVVAVGGDVSEAEAARIAEQLLALLPEGRATEAVTHEPKLPSGRGLVIVDKAERSQTQLGIGCLGTHPDDADHVALLVANTAFGGTFTSRLTAEVRAKRGWSYGASSHLSISRVRETFGMWTAPAAKDASACLSLEIDLLETWHNTGITEDELAFCQDYICRSYAFEIDTAKKRLQQRLERALIGLPDDYYSRYTERVRAVTLTQANEAVRQRIDPKHLWVGAVATESELGDALRNAIPDLSNCVVDPYDLE
jgi:zinc protease